MKKRKLIYFIILLIILVGLFSVYSLFCGNFIGRADAKNKVNQYLEKYYSDKDFKAYDIFYDFKFGSYNAKIKSEKEGLDFEIQNINKENLYDEYKEQPYLIDQDLAFKFSNTIKNHIKNQFEDILILNSDEYFSDFLDVYIVIKQGIYRDKTIEYSKEMTDKLYFTISTSNKEKALKSAEKLREAIILNQYNGFEHFTVSYYEGDIPYVIFLEKEQLKKEDNIENYLKQGIVERNLFGETELKENFKYEK